MDYHPDKTQFDVKAVFSDGKKVEFYECGLDELDDAYHIDVELVANDDGSYTLYMV